MGKAISDQDRYVIDQLKKFLEKQEGKSKKPKSTPRPTTPTRKSPPPPPLVKQREVRYGGKIKKRASGGRVKKRK